MQKKTIFVFLPQILFFLCKVQHKFSTEIRGYLMFTRLISLFYTLWKNHSENVSKVHEETTRRDGKDLKTGIRIENWD